MWGIVKKPNYLKVAFFVCSVSIIVLLCNFAVKPVCIQKEQHEFVKSGPPNLRVHLQPFDAERGHHGLTAAGSVGLGAGLWPIVMSKPKLSYSAICTAALVSFRSSFLVFVLSLTFPAFLVYPSVTYWKKSVSLT